MAPPKEGGEFIIPFRLLRPVDLTAPLSLCRPVDLTDPTSCSSGVGLVLEKGPKIIKKASVVAITVAEVTEELVELDHPPASVTPDII